MAYCRLPVNRPAQKISNLCTKIIPVVLFFGVTYNTEQDKGAPFNFFDILQQNGC